MYLCNRAAGIPSLLRCRCRCRCRCRRRCWRRKQSVNPRRRCHRRELCFQPLRIAHLKPTKLKSRCDRAPHTSIGRALAGRRSEPHAGRHDVLQLLPRRQVCAEHGGAHSIRPRSRVQLHDLDGAACGVVLQQRRSSVGGGSIGAPGAAAGRTLLGRRRPLLAHPTTRTAAPNRPPALTNPPT